MRSTTDPSPITMMATTEPMMSMSWSSDKSTPGGVGPQAPELDILSSRAATKRSCVSACPCPPAVGRLSTLVLHAVHTVSVFPRSR